MYGAEELSHMTIREAEEIQTLENLVSSMQKKIDNAKKKFAANRDKQDKEGVTTRSKAQTKEPEKAELAPLIKKSTRPDPQYRYVTPIEDPALIKKIAQQSLDTSITISA